MRVYSDFFSLTVEAAKKPRKAAAEMSNTILIHHFAKLESTSLPFKINDFFVDHFICALKVQCGGQRCSASLRTDFGESSVEHHSGIVAATSASYESCTLR